MRQYNRRDLEVHCPDSDSLASQIDENIGCLLRPGQDFPSGIKLDPSLQSFVGDDLLMRITDSVNLC